MIYGKRVVESHQWFHKKGPWRPLHIVDRTFQWKYTFFLTLALTCSAFVFLGPAWYFVNENYHLFLQLADRTEPALFEHLQRESTWLLSFLAICGLSIMLLCVFLGLRLTESIVGPIISLERHMRKVSRGDLSQIDFRMRATDDFRSLLNSYNYLFKSLRAQAEQDLKLLEAISIDPRNRDSIIAWQTLIRTRREQLGLAMEFNLVSDDSSGQFASTHDQRRAS